MPDVRVDEIGQVKLDRINAILKGIGNGSAPFKSVGAAMKRAADSGKTMAGRYASETYNISKSAFMSACKISSNMKGGAEGVASIELTFAGKVIRLIDFKPKGGPQGGVSAGPKKNPGEIRRAFIQAIYGERGVWERVGIKRLPVEQLYGPSTGQMMQDEGVSEKLSGHIMEVFDSRIEHEISRILGMY